MKFVLLFILIVLVSATSCVKNADKMFSASGRIVDENDSTFTLAVNDSVNMVFPKRSGVSFLQRLFISDSVVVNYTMMVDNMIVDDIILISHGRSSLSNVDELFVGTWSLRDSVGVDVTFNPDQTTDTSSSRVLKNGQWLVCCKKMIVRPSSDDDSACVYDILHVDDYSMSLCYEDKTIHFRRVK